MAKYTTRHTDLIYVPVAYFILYKTRYIYDLSLRLAEEDGQIFLALRRRPSSVLSKAMEGNPSGAVLALAPLSQCSGILRD